MERADNSNLEMLLETDWQLHQVYTGENIFFVIAKLGWLKTLHTLNVLIDEEIKPWLQQRNKLGDTCIHVAALANRGKQAIQLIEKLVEYGANLNTRRNCNGDTVLDIAVKNKDHELTVWLWKQPSINLQTEKFFHYVMDQMKLKESQENKMEILEAYMMQLFK
ncbi:viral ankyrin 2 [Bracoviriform demolitoris]|uniref:I-Kappa-B like protein N3 n=1 Tax=Microplitis demolitor bracovirus (isolate Webb) TaxID=654919 RepID=IKBN3_MDBVW|nr:viral ankyrin-3 [Microplitis demolitor]YP_239403.1 viral ankyrin 2 [Bracoviriform demolitoris]Q5I125.1 RecName: Full=I-Kappa-B like protein N3 [Microplitis demolitor bracovirus (isolate Webb)]AAW51805.1 viral ankyrin 2 [Bracoviriform demolitoris]KAG6558328.1 viral ankyrin N5 [Microplitis demolitor]